MDAIELIKKYDYNNNVFYLDPPYVNSVVRGNVKEYYKCQVEQENLVNTLLNLEAKCALSGYENDIYSKLLDAGWQIVRKEVAIHANLSERKETAVECLYIKL